MSDIEVFHTDRGSELDNSKTDEMVEAFGIERSLSRKGRPYDSAVDESTNKILKAEFVYREMFGTTRVLQAKLADYVHWYNNLRVHLTLGCMTPVEFKKAGLVLPKSSKKLQPIQSTTTLVNPTLLPTHGVSAVVAYPLVDTSQAVRISAVDELAFHFSW